MRGAQIRLVSRISVPDARIPRWSRKAARIAVISGKDPRRLPRSAKSFISAAGFACGRKLGPEAEPRQGSGGKGPPSPRNDDTRGFQAVASLIRRAMLTSAEAAARLIPVACSEL